MAAVCDAYLVGLSAGDADAIMELYAEHPTIEDPIGSEPKVGRDAIRAFYVESAAHKYTARRIGPVNVVGNHAAFQFRIDLVIGDVTIKLSSTDVMTFDEGGKVVYMVAYPDAEADPDAAN
jgi:steroid delta-isomerase